MKIDVLYLGRIECKKDYLIQCEDKDQMIKSPISAILIRHPTLGNILYDTGNSPFYSSEYSKFTLETYPIPEFISIEDALREKGLAPADIDVIILSHLHFDHAGGLRYFHGTKAIKNVLVSEAELKNAYYCVMTGQEGAYIKSLFDLDDIVFKAIKEETALANDLRLFIQNSHTPGVMGMILTTKSKGNIIATSDTIYTEENYEKQLPPGGSINKTQQEFYDNLARIKAMKNEYSAKLLYGHDYKQIVELHKNGSFE
jgi:glyoxylase-like metal-dependent hydrolase (beta-lactamase superfamily II)